MGSWGWGISQLALQRVFSEQSRWNSSVVHPVCSCRFNFLAFLCCPSLHQGGIHLNHLDPQCIAKLDLIVSPRLSVKHAPPVSLRPECFPLGQDFSVRIRAKILPVHRSFFLIHHDLCFSIRKTHPAAWNVGPQSYHVLPRSCEFTVFWPVL